MIEWWHLGLTAIGIIISTLIAMWNINRTRKKDLEKRFDKKADKTELEFLEKKVDKISDDCAEKTKELKQDFNNQVAELNDKFDMLVVQVIKVIKENK